MSLTIIGSDRVNVSWTLWTSWSVCSQTCGGGTSFRTRSCSNRGALDSVCLGKAQEIQSCQTTKCMGELDIYILKNVKIGQARFNICLKFRIANWRCRGKKERGNTASRRDQHDKYFFPERFKFQNLHLSTRKLPSACGKMDWSWSLSNCQFDDHLSNVHQDKGAKRTNQTLEWEWAANGFDWAG